MKLSDIVPGLALLACLSGLDAGAAPPATPADLVIRGGRLLDMATDQPRPRPLKALVIRDGRIERILGEGSAGEPPPAGRTIDAGDGYILPGLIDAHIHFRPLTPNAGIWRRGFLHYGVTSVQDFSPCGSGCRVGDPNEWLAGYKDLVNTSRQSEGPTLYTSGMKLDVADSEYQAHAHRLPGVEAIGPYVDYLAGLGVDFINLEHELPLEYRREAVLQAGRHGLPAAGHAPDIRDVIDSGQTFVEHMYPIAHALADDPPADLSSPEYDHLMELERAPALIEEMLQNELFLNPTMISRYGSLSERASEFTREDRALFEFGQPFSDVPLQMQPRILEVYRPPEDIDADELQQLREGFREIQAFLRMYSEAGGMVIAATDTVPDRLPGVSLHREMRMLVDAGIAPYRVLLGSTRWPARFLRKQDRIGTLEEGKQADVLILGSNPVESIDNTRDIRHVIRKGRVVRGPEDCSVILPPVSRSCWDRGYNP